MSSYNCQIEISVYSSESHFPDITNSFRNLVNSEISVHQDHCFLIEEGNSDRQESITFWSIRVERDFHHSSLYFVLVRLWVAEQSGSREDRANPCNFFFFG